MEKFGGFCDVHSSFASGQPTGQQAWLVASRNEFERIIDLEPEFAGGYAGLAYTSAFMAFWRHDEFWQQYVEEAIEYANKAIALDDSFGLSYSALAFAHLSNGEFDEALTISNVGVIKNPSNPYGNVYHGLVLALNGQVQKGVGYIQRALFLDPLNPRTPFLNILGFVQILAGEPEIALESMVRSVVQGGPVSSSNSIHRIIALISLNRIDEADKLIKDLQDISGFGLENWVGWIERSVRYQEDRDKLFNPLKKVDLI